MDPKEAFDWGLANRVVTTGTAFGQALNLAKEIVKFPQGCLRADRESALYATFRFVSLSLSYSETDIFGCGSAKNIDDALTYETEQSAKVVTTEAIAGAKKFAAGLGKHGKFNVNQIAEKEVGS